MQRPLPPEPFGSSRLPFGGLGAPILAPWEHLGGPFEQQDPLEAVWHVIFIDLEVILGPSFESFLGTEVGNFSLFSGLFPGHCLLSISESKFRCLGLLNLGVCLESIAKTNFPQT